MEKSCLFLRGQVWYWEDPIYSRKENAIDVPLGESTFRYSRYVIITQTEETMSRGSVLVVPCSSTNNTPHDVPIPLAHVFHEDISYAKTRGTFPVHVRFLQRYICTLPEYVMKLIEAEHLKMLAPSICGTMTNEEIAEKFNIDMNNINAHNIGITHQSLSKTICNFAKESLMKTGNESDIISVYEMKTAFDDFCDTRNFDNTDDMIEFIESFNRIPGLFDSKPLPYNHNIKYWEGLKFQKEVIPIIPDEKDLINESDLQRQGRWSDGDIIKFLLYYQEHELEDTSEKYGLKKSTATSYWYKWRSRLDETDNSLDINFENIYLAISKMSNIMRDTLIEQNVFEIPNLFSDTQEPISSDRFYHQIGICIYYSLLDTLGIQKDSSGKFYYPLVTKDSPCIPTWYFLDKIYHDRRISYAKNGKTLMRLFREYHGNVHTGIRDDQWLNRLSFKINRKFSCNENACKIITSILREIFCEIPLE